MVENMFGRFLVTAHEVVTGDASDLPAPLARLLGSHAGVTLADGFYRFHTAESARRADVACATLVTGFAGRCRAFAFDWLGRELAVDFGKDGTGDLVICVDPGGGEYLTTDCPFDEWHDAVAGEEDPLAYPFYEEWRVAHPDVGPLGFDQAIGYQVPLFLGGKDEVANLEIVSRDAYFEICTQLAHKVRELPVGSIINEFVITDQ
jgi:hypothetical protein